MLVKNQAKMMIMIHTNIEKLNIQFRKRYHLKINKKMSE